MTRLARTPVSATPWAVDSTTTTTQTVTGLLSDFKASQRDGVVIKTTDRRYLIAASGLTFTPEPGDQLTDSSKDLEVVTVETIRAGDVDVIHYLQVRA
jgi:hypothetical protein